MLNDRSPHSAGYESFSSLHGRAARWIYTQNNTRLINLQTLPVKVKKEDTQGRLTCETKEFIPMADPRFPRWGALTTQFGAKAYLARFLPKAAWKWNKLDREGRHVSLVPPTLGETNSLLGSFNNFLRWEHLSHCNHTAGENRSFVVMCSSFVFPEKLQNISMWETSAFKEHGDKKTDYLRILRIVILCFLKPTEQESLTYKLTTRIFSPKPLTTSEAARENKEEATISEKTFEDLQTLEGRVNSWLIRSGRLDILLVKIIVKSRLSCLLKLYVPFLLPLVVRSPSNHLFLETFWIFTKIC